MNFFLSLGRDTLHCVVSLPPHSASSLVVVVVITLLPSDVTQLRSLMGQVEPGNTFISKKLEFLVIQFDENHKWLRLAEVKVATCHIEIIFLPLFNSKISIS